MLTTFSLQQQQQQQKQQQRQQYQQHHFEYTFSIINRYT